MEVAVQRALDTRPRHEVKELYLDNLCRTSKPAGLEDLSSLTFLSLNNVGLTSLEGLPRLPKLATLEMSDNMIASGLSVLASATPRLEVLKLGGNRLNSLKELESLSRLKNLRVLDLYGNPVTQSPNYREKLFTTITSLEVLDGADEDGNEVGTEDEDDEGIEDELESVGEEDYEQIGSVLSKPYGKMTRTEETSEDESLEDDDNDEESEEGQEQYARQKTDGKIVGNGVRVLGKENNGNKRQASDYNDDDDENEETLHIKGEGSSGGGLRAAANKRRKSGEESSEDDDE
eukprot:jgi/Galph1/4362/GphlegSOOS_G2969.1